MKLGQKSCGKFANFHQAFHGGLVPGFIPVQPAGNSFYQRAALAMVDPMHSEGRATRNTKNATAPRISSIQSLRYKGDGESSPSTASPTALPFRHAPQEDQPSHLESFLETEYLHRPLRPRIRSNPCQYFCPAAVYEMVTEKGTPPN